MKASQAALDDVQRRWNAAADHWDAAALADVYSDDAMLFGGRPGHAIGRPAIHAYFGSYVGLIHQGDMQLVEQAVRLPAPGVLLAQGFVDFAFVLSGDQVTRSRLRTTLTLLQHGTTWQIAQHHFSPVPAVPPLGQS